MWSDTLFLKLLHNPRLISRLNFSLSLSLSLSVGQVRVKEVFEEDDCWYLVQELVSGGRVVDQ